ncbi:BTAD domain-containing putative transcriptional regulator [Jiangella endophytica]|uniref:BTAD domain-containing putative transcriptional regulator n=1 Tax=Jiangella endophytica TaxID=1623398 RepID=UPI000E344C44|nr:BTAD domain-containing putative transcriptional regulator [Jiangella endophytica]
MDTSPSPVHAGRRGQHVSAGELRLQILGPLRVWRDGAEVSAGPRQQAHLLALLLAQAGRPVSTSDLVDLIWGEDVPPSALNILQKYVGALRRLLEPTLPARGPGSYLLRRGNGYLFDAALGTLDVVTFRDLVAQARLRLAEQRPDAALDSFEEALGLWRGRAGGGLDRGSGATSVFAALDGEFFDACVTAAELASSCGRPERVLPPLRLAAAMEPFHEAVQASLVSTLAATGQQAEALAVFSAVRTRLAEELGIDPGPALLAAHDRVLHPNPSPSPPAVTEDEPPSGLVGRAEEFAVLRRAVEAALAGGTGLVVVEGEPGVGKTRLLEEIGADASRRGALVVWGRCLDGDGTPSMWPWTQAVTAVLVELPAAVQGEWTVGELGRLVEPRGVSAAPVLPDSGAQFRLFESTVAVIGQVSARRPVVLVVDDLQWADVASLQLFGHLAARLPDGVVIVGALRDRAPVPGSDLSRMLAATSRLPHHRRIRLGPLGPSEVTELLRRETGQDPVPEVASSIHARTAGNPFFVRELARLLSDDGLLSEEAAARAGVPSTVRDVVRDRIAGLDDDAEGLLQIAAIIGRDVDLALLARAAGIDGQTCLDRLAPFEPLGLLESMPEDPFSYRFAHDLVRESVTAATPQRRVSQLHLRVADALERIDADADAERFAHHLWAAGPLADPARTADALVRAGRRSAAKLAFEASERQLQSAAQVARTAGLPELEMSALTQLTAVSGMRAGYVGAALDLLERAEDLARSLGREREAADFLFSRWAAHSQGIQLGPAAGLARQLLEQGEASADPIVRAYGLNAWGIHQWDVGHIGAAYRYLSRSDPTLLENVAQGEEHPLRRDLRLLWPVMLAMMTALHGDVGTAWRHFDTLESAARDDPYVIAVWAAFAVTVAALSGDPERALRVAERGIATDPEYSFVFLGSYQRLARCWARAVTGDDPAGAAAEARRIVDATLLDPPRSGLATWYALLAEMWLAAGRPDEAAAALDRAETFLAAYGQRYPEGLVLLLRARLLAVRGEPAAVVQAAAERARAVSLTREAHLFVRRADEFVAGLRTS